MVHGKALAILKPWTKIENHSTVRIVIDGEYMECEKLDDKTIAPKFGERERKVNFGDKDTWVDIPDDTVCFLRTLVEAQVQNLYDDPVAFQTDGDDGIRLGVAMEMSFLKNSCAALNLDWDEVVQQESTEYERERIDAIHDTTTLKFSIEPQEGCGKFSSQREPDDDGSAWWEAQLAKARENDPEVK